MALTLDTSKPFRSISELTQLVRAIEAAPLKESEPDWLEWKREADLGDRWWHAQIAKFIAGFANRDPVTAKRLARGCAYLVIGVEPGNVAGVNPIDNANLDAGISRFVRPTVSWSPQYIQYHGKEVLVLTIEPPEYGDQIVAMLADFQSPKGNVCRKGDVFIRRHGRTDIATQEDYDMLVERFGADSRVVDDLQVHALSPVTAVPVACGPSEVREWLRRKEIELRLSDQQALVPVLFESRSPDEYRAEVASYLSVVAPLLPDMARAEALLNIPPSMQLLLMNETERNFSAARVEVSIGGNVWAYGSEEHARPDISAAPREWAESTWISQLQVIRSYHQPKASGHTSTTLGRRALNLTTSTFAPEAGWASIPYTSYQILLWQALLSQLYGLSPPPALTG